MTGTARHTPDQRLDALRDVDDLLRRLRQELDGRGQSSSFPFLLGQLVPIWVPPSMLGVAQK